MTKSDDLNNNYRAGTPLNVVVSMSESILDDVLTPLTEWLDQEDSLPIGAKMAVRLILEELLANTIMHGSVPVGSKLYVGLTLKPEGVEIKCQDAGIAFNPEKDLPEDSRNDDLDDRPVGQLGWPLILHYCSITEYRRSDDRNQLTLLFRFRS